MISFFLSASVIITRLVTHYHITPYFQPPTPIIPSCPIAPYDLHAWRPCCCFCALAQRLTYICTSNALRNDLTHPNEYIRGSTLRLVCKLKEPEVLEPLLPTVRSNLDHRHSYLYNKVISFNYCDVMWVYLCVEVGSNIE